MMKLRVPTERSRWIAAPSSETRHSVRKPDREFTACSGKKKKKKRNWSACRTSGWRWLVNIWIQVWNSGREGGRIYTRELLICSNWYFKTPAAAATFAAQSPTDPHFQSLVVRSSSIRFSVTYFSVVVFFFMDALKNISTLRLYTLSIIYNLYKISTR